MLHRFLPLLAAAALAVPLTPPTPALASPTLHAAAAAEETREWWVGHIALPGPQGGRVPIALCLGRSARGEWVGTLDIAPGAASPGVSALEVEQLVVTPTEVMFFAGGVMPFRVGLTRAGADARELTGSLELPGQPQLAVALSRAGEAEAAAATVARPQTPRPPYPYPRHQVTFTSSDDGLTLAGTLTLPAGEGPHPAVLLVSDGGPQNRDHEFGLHRPFLVIADGLALAGVAALRLDDRGVGGSEGNEQEATADQLAADLRAALALLASRPEIDPQRIGVLAVGEGVLPAALAAADPSAPKIAFAALLSPQILPGRDIALARERIRLEAEGEDPAFIAAQVGRSAALFDMILGGADQRRIHEALVQASRDALAALRGDGLPREDWMLQEMAFQQQAQLTTPRTRRWLSADPAEHLRKLRVPILAVSGGMDLQIPQEENIAALERLCRESGAPLTARSFRGVNHHLQRAVIGFADEVAVISTTIEPEILNLILEWTAAQAKAKR